MLRRGSRVKRSVPLLILFSAYNKRRHSLPSASQSRNENENNMDTFSVTW